MKIFVLCAFLYSADAGQNDLEKETPTFKNSIKNMSESHTKFSASKECGCSLKVEPVCADNGATFKNMCTLHCENQRRKRTKEEPLYVRCHYDCVVCVVIEWFKQ